MNADVASSLPQVLQIIAFLFHFCWYKTMKSADNMMSSFLSETLGTSDVHILDATSVIIQSDDRTISRLVSVLL